MTPYQFASNRPIDGVDKDGKEWEWAMKTLLGVYLDYKYGDPTGIKSLHSGIIDKIAVQSGQAAHQGGGVSVDNQSYINKIVTTQADAKILEGSAKLTGYMIEKGIDAISMIAPETDAVFAVGEKLFTLGGRKLEQKALGVGFNLAERATANEGRLSLSTGAEFLDDAIRMTDQSFSGTVDSYVRIMSKTTDQTALINATQRNYTEVGYQFQKHFGRKEGNVFWEGFIEQGATRNPGTFNKAGWKAYKEIYDAPGEFKKVGKFYEKRLPSGQGIRIQQNGVFKGFLDKKMLSTTLIDVVFSGSASMVDTSFVKNIIRESEDSWINSPETELKPKATNIDSFFEGNSFVDIGISTNRLHVGKYIIPNVFINIIKDADIDSVYLLFFFDLMDVGSRSLDEKINDLEKWCLQFQIDANFNSVLCRSDNGGDDEVFFTTNGKGPLFNEVV